MIFKTHRDRVRIPEKKYRVWQEKKIINDRQRARKVYGFVQRLPDPVSLSVTAAESEANMAVLDWKESVQFATTGSVTLPPVDATQAIDGSMNTLSDGDRILLKNQFDSSENGIYIVNTMAGTWSRTDDAIPGDTLTCGATVYVEGGSYNEGYKWILATKNVTLGGSQSWVLFDRGNDWIVSGSGGQMKTADPISIGADFPSTIASDVFFYVSGSRAALGIAPASADISVFAGDVVFSGSINALTSDGFYGDVLEISGSAKITTGSLFLQKAGTNDYVYFVNSSNGYAYQSGSLFLSGTAAMGYGSQALATASLATGIFSKATRIGEYSHASSGFAASFINNQLGKAQHSRLVWCGEADTGDSQLLFKGYNNSGTLSQLLELEDDKSYSIKATAVITDAGDQTDTAVFIRDAVFYRTGGTATRFAINSTLSLPNVLTYDFDIVASGGSIYFVIEAVSPPFGTVGDLRGTVNIEITEIQIS